jgi:hypothetical protein
MLDHVSIVMYMYVRDVFVKCCGTWVVQEMHDQKLTQMESSAPSKRDLSVFEAYPHHGHCPG